MTDTTTGTGTGTDTDTDTDASAPAPVLLHDGRSFALEHAALVIGRAEHNDVVVTDPHVSSVHGRVYRQGDRVCFEDLGSTNGSAVLRAAERIDVAPGQGIALADGDCLLLGDASAPVRVEVHIAVPSDAAPRPSAPPSESATLLAHYRADDVVTVGEGLSGLIGVLRRLSREDTPGGLVDRLATYLFETVPGARRITLVQLDDPSGAEAPPVLRDVTPDGPVDDAPPVSRSIVEELQKRRAALLYGDARRQVPQAASIAEHEMGAVIVAPVFEWEPADRTERLVAMLQVLGGPASAPFGREHLERVGLLAYDLGGLLSRVRLLERLRLAEGELKAENEDLKRRLGAGGPEEDLETLIVGVSHAIREVRRSIQLVAPTSTTVLISGETGTGKEVVARAIHTLSDRRAQRFAAVNCGAIPENLLESELFGHVRGAFTGAVRDKKGLFQLADGGTLFLDEIAELSPVLQVKLLRALQESEITPVGGSNPIPVDVRVLAATNKNLDKEVAEARFREDLYYRVHVFPLHMPPLRQRREDVVVLARTFADRLAARMKRPGIRLGDEALAALSRYDWPGNARELRNEIERALLFARPGESLQVDRFSERVQAAAGRGAPPAARAEGHLKDVMHAYEAQYLKAMLDREGGNRSRTARKLGISRQALIIKIQRYGIA